MQIYYFNTRLIDKHPCPVDILVGSSEECFIPDSVIIKQLKVCFLGGDTSWVYVFYTYVLNMNDIAMSGAIN